MRSAPASGIKINSYPKEYRLLKHADYDRVYKQGRRHFSPIMTFFYLERPSSATVAHVHDKARVGITVGRALGCAVVRNRIKRRMREAVRAHMAEFCAAPHPLVDVVINPKKIVLSAEFSQVLAEVGRGFSQIRRQLALTVGNQLAHSANRPETAR
ncbi:MAG: ribonuclease P protein component [Acidobacteriaceae bacterium]